VIATAIISRFFKNQGQVVEMEEKKGKAARAVYYQFIDAVKNIAGKSSR
jgi:hypothetical protein